MVEIKIGKNNKIVVKVELKKFLKGCLIFAMVVGWVFSGWPQIKIGRELFSDKLVVPPEIQEAKADTEQQSPDAYVTQTNLDGTIADIDEDPDSPDANWATTTDSSLDTLAHVSFPTPSGEPTTGAGLQVFKIYVRRSTALSTPTIYIDLYEGGDFVSNTSLTATDVTSDSGELFSGTWNAADLGSVDGSGVEAYVYGTKDGAAGSSSWVSPTSDVANGWTDSGTAWDDNTATFAYYPTPVGWGPYLELHHAELQCTKVRGWWNRVNAQVTTIEVDVFYSTAWHNIYSGAIVIGSFQEYEIGSTQSVTAMRVRFDASKANRQAEVYEADFWEFIPATYSSVDVGAVEWNVDYTPANPPVVEGVDLTPDPITLTENTTTTVYCSSTISDAQQGTDIVSATATIYRSGVTESCSADDNNCYRNITPSATSTSGTYFYATFTVDLWFHAEPTDDGEYASSSGWSDQTWQCYVIAEDSGGLTGTGTDSVGPELNSLEALIITSSINYGTLSPAGTSTVSQQTTVTSTGNIPIDVKLKGTNNFVSNGYLFDSSQQEYATGSDVVYGSGTTLSTTTYDTLELESLKPVQHDPAVQATATDIIYWRIAIPQDQQLGTYYSTTSVVATED